MYKYLFSDGTDITIEANNRANARDSLREIVYADREFFKGKRIEAEYVSKPCRDVTKKKVGDKEYIWVGFEASPVDGWMDYKEYKYLRSLIPIKGKKIK